MRVVVKSAVWDDLRIIGLTIAKANPGAAERFWTAAESTFVTIGRYP
jgi:plasmid stabilization system protein ParE